MTPNAQTSSGPSSSKLAPVDRAKQLAATLLSERSEASGALIARQLHEVLRALDASDRHGFQRYLATEFQPDRAARRKPPPRSRGPPIRPARNCCGESTWHPGAPAR
jgi:malonyl-CoA decarboxylase